MHKSDEYFARLVEMTLNERVDSLQKMQTALIGVQRSLHFAYHKGCWSCEVFIDRDFPSIMQHEEALSFEELLLRVENRLLRRFDVYGIKYVERA